jgi:probable H4MPT-linked C1 transfer pathway protein
MDLRWLALDIGGANLKAVHDSGEAREVVFEVWKHPEKLAWALADLAGAMPSFDRVAVTMTAELCDCYPSKRVGVCSIVDAVEEAFGDRKPLVWGVDGAFHRPEQIRQNPIVAAASNWLALAMVAASLQPDRPGILIDIGSTTTDLIPLDRGAVAVQGRSDRARLTTGELVYAGVRRTPVCTLATALPLADEVPVGLAAELFATMLDVFLVLGEIAPDPASLATADGRAATPELARIRLARMVGDDGEGFSHDDATALARSAREALMHRLVAAATRVCDATIGRPEFAVVAGSGEFLAMDLARRLLDEEALILSLNRAWGTFGSTAACARALLKLVRERPTAGEPR